MLRMPQIAHPLVGAWIVTFPAEPLKNLSLNSFSADGLVVQTNLQRPGQGVWAATGECTAVMTLAILGVEERELRRTIRVRAELTVDASGDGYTGRFTTERIELDG